MNIENKVIDEANQRTYVIFAPRVLSDGEIYRLIRQEILRRGGRPVGRGETLTLTLTAAGGVTVGSGQSATGSSPATESSPSGTASHLPENTPATEHP
jgi:hypothetical protein